MKNLMKVEQAAELLAVSQALIYHLCASGCLPHVRLGRPGRRQHSFGIGRFDGVSCLAENAKGAAGG